MCIYILNVYYYTNTELILWFHDLQSNNMGSSHHQLWKSMIVQVKHTASIHSANKLANLSKKKKKQYWRPADDGFKISIT